MLRRRPFSLPYDDQVVTLTAAIRGEPATVLGDPRRLVEAAAYHYVAGYVATAAESGVLLLPDPLVRALRDLHWNLLAHGALLRRELFAIDQAIDRAGGARPVLLKGPAVADRFYPALSDRPFIDVDLLLPRALLPRAAAALGQLGFEVLEEFEPGFGVLHGHDLHLRGAADGSVLDVELHWRIGDDPASEPLDHARLAVSAVELPVSGGSVLVCAPPEQLLVLSVHLLGDRAKRLVWVNDIARMGLSASDDDWQRAFTLADETGLSWALHRALDYARLFFGFDRQREPATGSPPPFGPLRAVEALDLRASTHVGRLVRLGWRDRVRYVRTVLVPTRAGLRGTIGSDGAPMWRLVGRHAWRVLAGLAPRR